MFSRAIFGICLLLGTSAEAACPADLDVCFRPGPVSCSSKIIDAINGARSILLVQAYGFTQPKIVQAVGDANKRGVQVRVILDKTNLPGRNGKSRYTAITYLHNAGVPVRVDNKVAIAHNKVIVIDGLLVIGGSYNYTRSAEEKNAENVTFAKGECIARMFSENFRSRWAKAEELGAWE